MVIAVYCQGIQNRISNAAMGLLKGFVLNEINLFYLDAIILLAGAVIAAPIFKKIGLGTVLGYLAAGVVIGPVLQIIRDGEEILQVAEIGIILLLFAIGLELKPSRLWSMRRDIFGMGLMQVVGCGIALTLFAYAITKNLPIAFIAGFGLALSSTAFALQMLEGTGGMNTSHGRKSLSILLFQDLAIIPLLAVVPLLTGVADFSGGIKIMGSVLAAIAFVVVAGKYLLNPLFGIIARTGAREAMIAAALFVVLGAAFLMQLAGVSMALGAFLAGVMLAESSFRHELEADIEPFRGILLGLFFIAIGLSIDLSIILKFWWQILVLVPMAMLIKAAIIYLSARVFGNGHPMSVRIAGVLSQHGEFGFVLFAAAASVGIIETELSSILVSMVVLSMVLTPVSMRIGKAILASASEEEIEEDFSDAGGTVLMIGFSRMGQVASQTLLAAGYEVTMIDNDPRRIRNAADFGFRVYFGDGTRKNVLRVSGIEQASLVAVCTHNPEVTSKIVDLIRTHYPEKAIYVRAYDRTHALELMDKDVSFQIRETFESALVMGSQMLQGLGLTPEETEDIVDDVRRLDTERLNAQKLEGIFAGKHLLHVGPVKPEPLVEPHHGPEGVDKRSRELIEEPDEQNE